MLAKSQLPTVTAFMPDIIVAGHLCLDIIPEFHGGGLDLAPGALTQIGPAVFTTGGCVSNVGLALLKLGVNAELMGKVGVDAFGTEVRHILGQVSPQAVTGVKVSEADATSYTLVLNPPGVDRHFLHHAGANDTFGPEDVDFNRLEGAKLFYFGYPPLMRRMFANGGSGLAQVFKRVRSLGLVTALDMSLPDPDSAAGEVDWSSYLQTVLPHTDIFVPSLPETVFMLKPELFSQQGWRKGVTKELLLELTQTCLDFGAGLAGLKLGGDGLYLRGGAASRLAEVSGVNLGAWADVELYHPAFQVEVAGTVGAGDAAYAGLLASLLRGLSPQDALQTACAVGACSVESLNAHGGVLSWEKTRTRLAEGWGVLEPSFNIL